MKILKKILKKVKIMKIIHIGTKSQIIDDKVKAYYENLNSTIKLKKTIKIVYFNKFKRYKVGELYKIHIGKSGMNLIIECLSIATIDIHEDRKELEYIVEFLVLFSNKIEYQVGAHNTFWKTSPMDNGSKHLKEKITK